MDVLANNVASLRLFLFWLATHSGRSLSVGNIRFTVSSNSGQISSDVDPESVAREVRAALR